jgi:AcrR family transcriptional regulator
MVDGRGIWHSVRVPSTRTSAIELAPLGRPRDPAVDARILRAAIEVFGDDGWGRFSIEAVARRAGVGKASVYLRWPNKEALLATALAGQLTALTAIDTGSVRDDLVSLAAQLMDSYLGAAGPATIRLLVHAESVPGVRERIAEIQRGRVLAARAIVRRGIARGELRPGTNVTYLLDAVCGGVLSHVLATPPQLRRSMTEGARRYVSEFVDFVLSSVVASKG